MSIYTYSTPRELLRALDPEKHVFIDTETSKLGSQIRLVQVFQEGWDSVLIFDTNAGASLTQLWSILQSYKLVGHNILYDFNCFKVDLPKGMFSVPKEWEDTFYLSRLVHPEWNTAKGYSLDSALAAVLGYDPYSKAGLKKKELQLSFERLQIKGEYIEGKEGLKDLTESQLVYASIDVLELPNLWHEVEKAKEDFVYKLDKLTVEHILDDEKGMPVDTTELAKLEAEDITTIAEVKKRIGNLNVNSYMQVRKVLGTVISSDEMALQIIQHRPGGLAGLWTRVTQTNGKWAKALREGLDNKTLSVELREFGVPKPIVHSSQLPTSNKVLVYAKESSYVQTDDKIAIAKDINTMRKALKRLNFVSRARSVMDEDNRISATFSPHAINGRIQQDNENLSQYPRAMKKMWGHPKGNCRKLLYCDYAQIELRVICAALPEMNMYKALKNGEDLHSFVAENFNFSEEEKAMLPAGQTPRQVAKQSNFLLLYGGGKTNFQRVVCRNSGVWFSDEMSNSIVDKWKNIFSDIKLWHDKNSKSKTNMDKTVSGRPYKASIVTDLNNIKVSGTGSEVFKLWLHYIAKYMLPYVEDTYIVNRVHDAVYIDLSDNPTLYKACAVFLTKLAQKAWFEIIKQAPLTDVPMPCDAGVGSNLAGIDYGYDVDYSYTLEPYYMLTREIEPELAIFKEALCG